VNADSCTEGEIKERITAGNRTYRVHKKKKRLIRPTVTYASEI